MDFLICSSINESLAVFKNLILTADPDVTFSQSTQPLLKFSNIIFSATPVYLVSIKVSNVILVGGQVATHLFGAKR